MSEIKLKQFWVPCKFRSSLIERMKWRIFYWFYKKQIQIILDEMNHELDYIYWRKNRRAGTEGEK